MAPFVGSVPTVTAPALAVATFPRIYRVSKGWRIFCLILASVPIGFGAVGEWYFATGNDTQTLRETAGFTGLCLAFVLFGIYMAASTIRSKLVLEESLISISGLFRTRSIHKPEIAGRRLRPGYNGSAATLVFMPSHPGIKKLKIPRMFATDATFDAWLANIPERVNDFDTPGFEV
jgi:hypothetical protein